MNEVTKIHLGRQAFTISVAAQKELRTYLDAIARQIDDADVTNEIELRMAELLTERGVTGDKVVLPADITYLKEQLGDPKDFTEDGETAAAKTSAHANSERRLFRDTKNAWIGGVASGIAAYFGVDPLLVRVLFVLGTLAWGGSILLYIALWLLVPEAKTSSDRLQMAGKPITVEGLKEAVDRADVKGAAQRAGNTLSGPAGRVSDVANTFFGIIVKIVGIGLTLSGLLVLAGLAFSGIYLLAHGNIVAYDMFPQGLKEHVLVYITAFVATMIAIFIVLFGMAVYARKWPIRGWLTGVLIGLSLIGLVIGSALAADTVPRVRDRYNAHTHTTVRPLAAFSSVNMYGKNVSFDFQTSNTYSVTLKYFGDANTGAIKTTVANGTLTIDSQHFDWQRNCSRLCIPDSYNMVITVNSPTAPQLNFHDDPSGVTPPRPPFPVDKPYTRPSAGL